MVGAIFTGCKNNSSSTSDSSGTTTTETTTASDQPLTEIHDSGTVVTTPADHGNMAAESQPVSNMSEAKPNPAKKGMKGKVVLAPETKSTAQAEVSTGVYSSVDVIPSFPGGYAGMQKYFDKNLQYPYDASGEGVEGVVNVSFTVDENGRLTSAQTVGPKLGYGLEEEAMRVVKNMPAWNPGKLKGQNVKTKYTLPVRFQLY